MAGFDVVVMGALHLDVVVRAPRLPRTDETVPGESWRYACGGKGGNQAVMASRLGARTAMIGRLGADDFGTRLLAHLDNAGVDRTHVAVDADHSTGMSVAVVDATGEYGAVIVSGANLALTEDAVATAVATLGSFKVMVLQNEVPDSANTSAAAAARARGARIVYNAAPARSVAAELTALVDVLVVNRIEAEALLGRPVASLGDAKAAALASRARATVVTLGADGSVLVAAGEPPIHVPARQVEAISTHGAGDAFVGALAVELSQAAPLQEAVHIATAAAAAYVALPEVGRSRFSRGAIAAPTRRG